MGIDSFLSAYGRIFRNMSSQLAATPFTLALLSIGVIWALFALSITFVGGTISGQVKELPGTTAAILVSLFLIMFFIIWDYSHLREEDKRRVGRLRCRKVRLSGKT
jgi:hypothetical protein